jgi:hypothetical protein
MRIHDSYLFFNILVARELKRLVASLWHCTSSANVSVKKPILFSAVFVNHGRDVGLQCKKSLLFFARFSCIVFTHFYRMPPPIPYPTAKKERSKWRLIELLPK